MTQRNYQAAVDNVRSRVTLVLQQMWGALPSYRDANIETLVSRVVPLVQGGQVQVANLTAAYFRDNLGVAVPVDRQAVTGGRGVPAADVYQRPASTVYGALANGKPLPEAVAAGAARLASLAQTDLQMSKVRQAQHSLQDAGVRMFRRVLTGNENCALCVIASTQRYFVKDLSPIHPGCDCSVDVMPRGWNPEDQVIDPELLESTHEAVARKLGRDSDRGARDAGIGKYVTYSDGERLADYTELLAVREHGEYGPTLTWRGDKFTSAVDLE